MNNKLTFALVVSLACLSLASLAFAQTCQEIHGLGTNGCAPSPLAGNIVTVTGVIYVVPGTFNSGGTYWQCGAGGLTLFDSGLAGLVEEGDEVSVEGTVAAFNEEIQLNSTTVTVLSSNNPVFATPISTGALQAGTDLLGSLMLVQGILAKTSAGFNSVYTLDDGTGPVIMFVDGTTGMDTALLDAWIGDVVKVTGATKCYLGEGEILPRRDSDVCLVSVPNGTESFGAVKAMYETK